MFKAKLVPGLWGALATSWPLSAPEIETRARDLLGQMTLDEKIGQMAGDTPLLPGLIQMARAYNYEPIPAGENLRLGIPGIRFTDGPRGVVMYHSTCFPVSIARGATWDPALEARVGDAMGVEARSQGANYFGGVCINLLRHPAWGRAQETYGEDPYHLGEMGAALVRGVQRHVMACVKHYAANSIENSRMKVNVRLDERTLREVYLPHFRRCVDEGAASVMSAYNRVNGEYCSENAHLLRDILKGEWDFQGFVLSDFLFAIHDGEAAIRAGLDVEMPFARHYGRRLKRLVQSGRVPEAWIDEAVLRILRQKVRFAGIGEPERYGPQAVASAEHRTLAREVAQKSMVLLKNDPLPGTGCPLLPIDCGRVKRLAVIGRLTAEGNIGDHGSSRVRPPHVVSPLAGIEAAAISSVEVLFDRGGSPAAAAEVARRADAAIVVAGYSPDDEGERMPNSTKAGDRASLRLATHDEALIQAVAAANPATVVVLIGGSAVVTEAWRRSVPAMLMAWYPGMEGGHALADLLFGVANPSGKLPCTFPQSGAHLPPFDPRADLVEYGYYHGYRLLERDGHEPAFAFGFGLSYTTFRYGALHLDREAMAVDGELRASVAVTNSGPVAGDEIVQIYAGCETSGVDRPAKELKGFARVSLAPGETRTVPFRLRAEQLAYYDAARGQWAVEPGEYRLFVGGSSRPGDLLRARFRVVG
jgi:beta-glucosidase